MRLPASILRSATSAASSSVRARPTLRVTAAACSSRAVAALPSIAASRSFSTTLPALKKGGKEKGGKADKASKGGKGGKASKGKEAEEDSGLSAEEITQVIEKAKQRMSKSSEWARAVVYEGVERGRGRVTPALLDSVKVTLPDSGAVPLNQVASVTVKQNVLVVEAWDPSAIKHVESALHKANLPGLSPQRDADIIRIPVPRPTGDVRTEILKSIAETVETAKNQVRQARMDALKALGGRGEEGTDDVQKLADGITTDVEKLVPQAKKEFEKA